MTIGQSTMALASMRVVTRTVPVCALPHDGRHWGQPAQFFGPLQRYQPTLSPPPSRTLRVPAQLWTLALASDLRSSLTRHFLDHGRVLAADDPSTSPYAANALLPMSAGQYGAAVQSREGCPRCCASVPAAAQRKRAG